MIGFDVSTLLIPMRQTTLSDASFDKYRKKTCKEQFIDMKNGQTAAPERVGDMLGYAWVSTADQDLARILHKKDGKAPVIRYNSVT